MKNKILKFLTVFFIIVITFTQTSFVYASLVSNAQGESGHRPPPPTPSDSPHVSPSTPSTPTGPGYEEETIYYYTTISGNVYEDLGYNLQYDGSGLYVSEDDKRIAKPIKGVNVYLKSGGAVVDTVMTDESGNYSFSPPDGNYYTEFWYGGAEDGNLPLGDKDLMKNILKYNGQDYITTKTPSAGEYIEKEAMEIKTSGKGAAQVFLAIDCSYSMRSTNVKINGKTKKRLEIAIDSAKKLINSLIDSGSNIYIGLVFFSGTNYRAVSLTKNKDILENALDGILENDWYTANTDIGSALQKAKDSFYNNEKDDSNRYITIISDGIPTKYGGTEVYCDESESESLNKIYNMIAPSTRDKVKELKDDGINIISLFTKSDDAEENDLVADIFQDSSSTFASVQDGDEIIEFITKNIQELVLENKQIKEYVSTFSTIAGYEDSARRNEVDGNFNKMNYKNTIIFEMINNYDGSDEAKKQAKKLSELTKMRVVGGQDYAISHKPSGTPAVEEIKDEEGEIIKKIYHVETGYSGQNLVLTQRPEFSLVTTVTATRLRIFLANNLVLGDQSVDPNSNWIIEEHLDNEIAHGSTIEIEYSVCVKNDSPIQCNYLELINHLPKSYSLKEVKLAEGHEDDYCKYEKVDLKNLIDESLITKNTLDTHNDKRNIKIVLDNNGEGANGFYIPPGGEYVTKIIVTRMINNMDEIHNDKHELVSEVLTYENSSSRRMADIQLVNAAQVFTKNLLGIYPGDDINKDRSQFTNQVFILVPTGNNLSIKIMMNIVVSVFSLTIICKIGLYLKNKIKGKSL